MAELSFKELAFLYRKTLLQDVVPFWIQHAVDPDDGALNNCIDDDGNVQSYDRYLWSQGRALWTFSALYNRVEPRSEWLNIAHGIAHYLYSHGRDEQGRWVFRLDKDGNVLDGPISIYVDGFVLNGLGEYYRATKDPTAAELAVATWRNVSERLANPGSYGIAPYNIPPGSQVLGIPMIFSFFFWNLGDVLQHEEIKQSGLCLAEWLLHNFYDADFDVVMEFRSVYGGRLALPEGGVVVPGHVIEAMWFLISIFEVADIFRYREVIAECCRLIRRHIELGWDPECGGIKLAIDVEGRQPVAWRKADCKAWWVHTEALVATICAYLHTHQKWCLEWHRLIQEFSFSHYPVPGGEWRQWLDRSGAPSTSAALPVKDPFHLPRALIYLIHLLNRCT
ncbi:MAG: AGE family epimerase/isomerase [Armatimonadota bacterium]